MSTKKIEEALEALEAALGHPNTPVAISGVWAGAREELEAIRKAARAYMRAQRNMSDVIAIDQLMESIAKEASEKMSTKALEEILEYMREQHGSGMMEDGLAELTAIKHAAHVVVNVGQSEAAADRYPEWVKACELLRAIAKEAS